MNLKLSEVETTAQIPLSNHASETRRKNPRIRDRKAVEIIEALRQKREIVINWLPTSA